MATRHFFELVANGERENRGLRGPELSSCGDCCGEQGKLLSSLFVVQGRYVDERRHSRKTASILKETLSQRRLKRRIEKIHQGEFPHLVNDISLGQVLGSEDGLGNAKDLRRIMKMCGGEPEPIVIRVIGASRASGRQVSLGAFE
ncbi:MAG: hypothetical protein IPQ17_02000 [Xanthomonadales bacterium]|nr:hypothetical protein [Xanthomonadales bacterium]